jgi:hypothetical protein
MDTDPPRCPAPGCGHVLDYRIVIDEPELVVAVPVCVNPECETNKES